MPIVEVTHDADVPDAVLDRLAAALPHAVSVAVACPEEPYEPPLAPGDVDVRFRHRGPRDAGGLAVVVEVRSKWTATRADDRQRRADDLGRALAAVVAPYALGVLLDLPVAAWAEPEAAGADPDDR